MVHDGVWRSFGALPGVVWSGLIESLFRFLDMGKETVAGSRGGDIDRSIRKKAA